MTLVAVLRGQLGRGIQLGNFAGVGAKRGCGSSRILHKELKALIEGLPKDDTQYAFLRGVGGPITKAGYSQIDGLQKTIDYLKELDDSKAKDMYKILTDEMNNQAAS